MRILRRSRGATAVRELFLFFEVECGFFFFFFLEEKGGEEKEGRGGPGFLCVFGVFPFNNKKAR